MPLWKDGSLFDSSSKIASNDEPQPSSDAEKKDDEGVNTKSRIDDQERPKNSTQGVNTVGLSSNTKLDMFSLGDNATATHADFFNNETEVDMRNITTTYPVPSTPNTRIYKDHLLDHVIGDVQSSVKERRMTKTTNEQGLISVVYEGKTHEGLYTCLFACFISQEEPKKEQERLKRLISWQCKKQTIVANSTTEAGYVTAVSCCGQVLWIQNQMLDYGYNFMNTKIFIDNETIICIVKNPVFHSKTKHIKIRHHFIKDSNEKKLIQMIKIHTDQNVIDLLTKAFDVSRFQYLIATANDEIQVSTVGLTFYYALAVNPTIYTSCIKQFWATTKAQTVNGEVQIQALVYGKKVIITETSVRRALQLKDAEGTECLPNATIFAKLERMGAKTTAWNEFSSTMASTIICLATNQNFNFSKYIFDNMKKQPRRKQRKDTEVPQPSGSTEPITDEAANEEHVPLHSNDPLLSGKDRLKLNELMELCTNLSQRVLDLENTKTSQATEITKLKERVKKLERRNKFEVEKMVSTAEVTTVSATTTTVDELTLAQTLIEIKAAKPKAVTTAAITTIAVAKDKGKGKMVESEKPLKKKDQILIDEEIAQRLQEELQAELGEKERLARQKE
ncbi:hypothetical protein Tco_0981798 [Tanacetum coccineum]